MIDSLFNLIVMTLACPEARIMLQCWLEQENLEEELENVA